MVDPKIVIDDVYRTLTNSEVFIRNLTFASDNVKEEDVHGIIIKANEVLGHIIVLQLKLNMYNKFGLLDSELYQDLTNEISAYYQVIEEKVNGLQYTIRRQMGFVTDSKEEE